MTDPIVNPHRAVDSITESLLLRVRQLDEDAWCRLVETYAPLVYHWCQQNGVDLEETKDVTQDVFLSVRQNLDQFERRTPQDSFRAWLRTITRNKLRDRYRKKGPARAVGGDLDPDQIDTQLEEVPSDQEQREEVAVLYQQVVASIQAEFSDRDWQAFWLVAAEERSVNDVAQLLDTTPNVIYLARTRIRKRMNQLFSP